MSVTKDTTGKWMSQVRVKDYTGKTIHKKKRGFATKKEALEWERDFLNKANADMGMLFRDFVDLYFEDMGHRLKESTIISKRYMVDKKILPVFGKIPINEITPRDIRKWQNGLTAYRDKNGKPYAQTYLRAINNQITAMFNYAVKYHDLRENPCTKAGSMGKSNAEEMQFWTKAEFEQFITAVQDKPASYTAFMTMYYTGMRVGELCALTPADVDLKNNTIAISKTFQRINGKDVVWAPIDLGAKEIATKVLKDTEITTEEEKTARDRQCGYNFQWGRKVPFVYGEEGVVAPSGIPLVTYANATKSDYQYANMFIPNANSWFSDYTSFNKNWPKENDPCPAGWRVPTKEELQIVSDQVSASSTTVDGTWSSTTHPAFVLPLGGNRDSDTGIFKQRGELGGYWTSTFESGKAYRLNSAALWGPQVLTAGYNVRCVKE